MIRTLNNLRRLAKQIVALQERARSQRLDGSRGVTTPRKKAPEITFQQHIADFLVYEHGYGVLEQTEITNTEHFIGRGPGRFFGGKGLLNAEWRMRSAVRVEERVSGEAVKEDVPDFVALQCGP